MDEMTRIVNDIRSRADALDLSGDWPEQDVAALASAGIMRAAVPAEFGGADHDALDIHLNYERIAAASLAVALILSQRDSACGLIDGATPSALRGELLSKLARNELFATVGIAQLTTSRQRGTPALTATKTADGYRLAGSIPWSTGAAYADYVVAGAVDQDRQQILFALPRHLQGVRVEPPLHLVALRASHTSTIVCDSVELEQRFLLRGPTDQVLSHRRRNLSIGQAFLAMGLCGGALDLIARIDSSAARQAEAELHEQLRAIHTEVIAFSRASGADPALSARLRGACNDLAIRTSHAAVALHKGTGLIAGHPAQRLARESMFLLVWSCPAAVVDCTLELLTCAP